MAIGIQERIDDPQEAQRAALEGFQAELHTTMPGIIVSFDPAKQTAVIQPAVKGRQSLPDGSTQFVDMPLLLDVPIHFPSGGGATLTFPIKPGDECQVNFGSRDMSSWWQSGGTQPPIEARMHDLSDGFATVGIRSQPRKLPGGSHPDHVELRSDDGASKISLDPASGAMTITSAATLTIQTTGAIALTSPTLTHNGHDIGATHKHTGVVPGSGLSGPPQ